MATEPVKLELFPPWYTCEDVLAFAAQVGRPVLIQHALERLDYSDEERVRGIIIALGTAAIEHGQNLAKVLEAFEHVDPDDFRHSDETAELGDLLGQLAEELS